MENINIKEKMELRKRVVNAFVETDQVKSVYDAVKSCRIHHQCAGPDVSQNHLFILGQSRVGKTRTLKRYSFQKTNSKYVKIDTSGNEIDTIPVLFVDILSPFTMLGFYQRILEKLGAPIIKYAKIEDTKRQATNLLEDQGVEVLILDEIQSFIYSKYVTEREAMETIKDISNKSNVSIIGCGLPQVKKVLDIDNQYSCRFRVLEMKPFTECNNEFISYLRNLEEQIDTPFPLGLSNIKSKLPQLLFEISEGLPGKIALFTEELFVQLGIDDDTVELSQMKVTRETVKRTVEKIRGINS